jgi:hypothetical protein
MIHNIIQCIYTEKEMVDFNPQDFEQNPLRKYFRQPKIHIPLPSKGKFYPEGALELPETGEVPVFAMTAKDELVMKTPDALLNGSATVEIIKSCVPAIKDPWKMPTLDLDAVLIAIRIATYGKMMEITAPVPGVREERTFEIDLQPILNKLVTANYVPEVSMKDMTVYTRPLTYREFTKTSLATFEQQRVFAIISDDNLTEEEKIDRFNTSFSKLTELTVETMNKSIWKVTVGDTEVTNQAHIQEFMQNSDKEFYSFITEHLETQRTQFAIEPLKVHSTEEDIKKGAPEEWEVPITFDASNFFG